MNYAVEMIPGAMIYISSSINIGSWHSIFLGGIDTQTAR
jgi:hypothetical protein